MCIRDRDKIDDLVDDEENPPRPSTPGSGGSNVSSSSGGINAALTNDREEIKLPQTQPEQPEQTDKYFNDLDNAAWAEEAINNLYGKEIISGYGDNTFKPSNSMTREEFAVLAVKAFGLLDEDASCDFEDVSEDVYKRQL